MNQGKIEQIGTPQHVYDSPATPFVYQFLGNVNAFEGRVNAGVAKLGSLEVPVTEFAQTHDSAVQAFARPHDIDISRDASDAAFKAKLTYVHSAGSVVRLELKREDVDTFIEAELTREHYSQLNLREGETVYLDVYKRQGLSFIQGGFLGKSNSASQLHASEFIQSRFVANWVVIKN